MSRRLILWALIAVAVLVVGAIWYERDESTVNRPEEMQVSGEDADVAGEPFIGEANAPVTILYWLDFQCPFCRRFEKDVLPTIVRRYVEAGTVRIVFKDLPFIGEDSHEAALVSHVIWELYPQNYFAWQEAMFESQDAENGGFGSRESIFALIAKEFPGMNSEDIRSRLLEKEEEYRAEQEGDKREAEEHGIRSTPGFL